MSLRTGPPPVQEATAQVRVVFHCAAALPIARPGRRSIRCGVSDRKHIPPHRHTRTLSYTYIGLHTHPHITHKHTHIHMHTHLHPHTHKDTHTTHTRTSTHTPHKHTDMHPSHRLLHSCIACQKHTHHTF